MLSETGVTAREVTMGRLMSTKKRLRLGATLVAVAAVLLLILLLRRCGHDASPPVAKHGPILVPADLAHEYDVAGILDYCRNTVRHDDTYEGLLRGAHGTLWAGSGNAVDRACLACTALSAEKLDARYRGGNVMWQEGTRWMVADFHGNAPPRGISQSEVDGAGNSPALPAADDGSHEITAAFVLEGRDGSLRRVELAPPAPGSAGTLAYWVAEAPVIRCGGRKRGYTLRVGASDSMNSGPLTGVKRASIEFALTFRATKTVLTRELFDEANAAPEIPGNSSPRRGDLYAIVVAPGPFLPVAYQARAFLADRSFRDASRLALLGVEYFVAADERTGLLAKKTGVRVGWPEARVAIASVHGKKKGRRGLPSLDVLLDRVEATGDDARAFHTARGLANDLVETRILHGAVKRPVISASTVLSRHASPEPATAERRIALLTAEGERLLADAPFGTRVGLRAGPQREATPRPDRPWAPDTNSCDLLIERGEAGLVLVGARLDPAATEGWRHFNRDPKFRLQMKNAGDLARTAEAILGARVAKRSDYLLELKAFPALPSGALPVHERSVLTYRATTERGDFRIAVLVTQKKGKIGADWVDLGTRRRGKVDGSWEEALKGADDRPEIKAIFGPVVEPGDTRIVRVSVDKAAVDAHGRDLAAGDASALLYPLGERSLILEWKRGKMALVLESASPVTRGEVVDAATGLPVPGARVSRLDGRGQAAAAADGTFALPLPPPLFRRLILLMDLSGSMKFSLDPKSDGRDDRPGQPDRMGEARKAVTALLEQLPPGVEVGVWGYGQLPGRDPSADPASTRYTRVICQFTENLKTVKESVDRAEPFGFTPLTGALNLLSEHAEQNVLSRDAIVLLLGDGENSDNETTAAAAYLAGGSGLTVHCVGFAIEKGGAAEKQLSELAAAAGGSYRTVLDGAQLTRLFHDFGKSLGDVRLRATARGYDFATAKVDDADFGKSVRIALVPSGDTGLLTVRRENFGDLAKCAGLSPKARATIEKRVSDGGWAVTLPRSRTNVGRISAYAWFERELATGRITGVTEDGLHGSAADEEPGEEGDGEGGDDDGDDEEDGDEPDSGWPPFIPHADDIPFVSWMQGITAYTAGSVVSAMKWHNEPGFFGATSTDFLLFVQENALEYCYTWWEEVGSGEQNEPFYWSGVCLNFALQSMALPGGTGDGCLRAWARSICNRLSGELADKGIELGSDAAKGLIKEEFGEEWNEMLEVAKDQKLFEFAKDFEEEWKRLVDEGMGCERLQHGNAAPR
ncbi:MAG: hypothetical protein FD180_2848 [Planctomycetota bacterium]|nr:MAG: hypothetical protein FD180_2848 [Planctomycetota bacterium]